MTNWKEYNQTIVILTLLICAFCLRFFPIQTGYHYWDESVYLQHSEILADERENNYDEFDIRPPLFFVFLASIQIFTDSLILFHFFVALISTFTVFMLYRLGRELFNYRTGILSASTFAVTPISVSIANELLADSLVTLTWVITCYLYVKFEETESQKILFLIGITTSLAILAKFTSLLLIPILGFLIIQEDKLSNLINLEHLKRQLFMRRNFIFLTSLVVGLSPYLGWNMINYGNLIHSFINGLNASGTPTPITKYLENIFVLLPISFLGLSVLASLKEPGAILDKIKKLKIPLSFSIPLVIALHILSHKEPRYMLPAIPFLILSISFIISDATKNLNKRIFNFILLTTILMAFIVSPISLPNLDEPNKLTTDWNPEYQKSATWIKENYGQNTTLYTSIRYPPLAYYSRLPTEKVWGERSYKKVNMSKGDLIYYTEESPFKHPKKSYLEGKDFKKVKEFGGFIYIYEYTG